MLIEFLSAAGHCLQFIIQWAGNDVVLYCVWAALLSPPPFLSSFMFSMKKQEVNDIGAFIDLNIFKFYFSNSYFKLVEKKVRVFFICQKLQFPSIARS